MRIVIMICALILSIVTTQAQEQTKEYRMWSAEQMITRLTDKLIRAGKACEKSVITERQEKLSEKCKEAVAKNYSFLATIREVAMSGDSVRWAEVIDAIHKYETGIEAPLNYLERQ